eukprot:3204816-Amphidinium_carterae.1
MYTTQKLVRRSRLDPPLCHGGPTGSILPFEENSSEHSCAAAPTFDLSRRCLPHVEELYQLHCDCVTPYALKSDNKQGALAPRQVIEMCSEWVDAREQRKSRAPLKSRCGISARMYKLLTLCALNMQVPA